MTSDQETLSVYQVAVRRTLLAAEPDLVQLHFDVAVLQKYREAGGFSIIRTDTVGRVRKQGGWSLDFGISPDEAMLHLAWADVMRLPEGEREHWAGFVSILPSSRMFLSMRLAPGSCFDDGEVRTWE